MGAGKKAFVGTVTGLAVAGAIFADTVPHQTEIGTTKDGSVTFSVTRIGVHPNDFYVTAEKDGNEIPADRLCAYHPNGAHLGEYNGTHYVFHATELKGHQNVIEPQQPQGFVVSYTTDSGRREFSEIVDITSHPFLYWSKIGLTPGIEHEGAMLEHLEAWNNVADAAEIAAQPANPGNPGCGLGPEL